MHVQFNTNTDYGIFKTIFVPSEIPLPRHSLLVKSPYDWYDWQKWHNGLFHPQTRNKVDKESFRSRPMLLYYQQKNLLLLRLFQVS